MAERGTEHVFDDSHAPVRREDDPVGGQRGMSNVFALGVQNRNRLEDLAHDPDDECFLQPFAWLPFGQKVRQAPTSRRRSTPAPAIPRCRDARHRVGSERPHASGGAAAAPGREAPPRTRGVAASAARNRSNSRASLAALSIINSRSPNPSIMPGHVPAGQWFGRVNAGRAQSGDRIHSVTKSTGRKVAARSHRGAWLSTRGEMTEPLRASAQQFQHSARKPIAVKRRSIDLNRIRLVVDRSCSSIGRFA